MKHSRREQGYALLMVLIAVGLVAILLGQIENDAGTAARTAGDLRDQAQAQQTADGAIWHMLYAVLPGQSSSWAADGGVHQVSAGGVNVAVSAEDLADRLDLNRDSPAAIAVLLQAQGLDSGSALALGQKLVDWRSGLTDKEPMGAKLPDYQAAGLPYGPPNANFENLAEMELVLGMTPAIAVKLAPLVTVYSFGQPQIAAARTPLALEALRTALRGQPTPPANPASVFFFELTARARAGDATAIRHAVVRIDMNQANEGKFWRLVDWE